MNWTKFLTTVKKEKERRKRREIWMRRGNPLCNPLHPMKEGDHSTANSDVHFLSFLLFSS